MKKTPEELIAAVKALVGERNDDAVIALIEDISDSFVEDTEDWKAKYYELDKLWRDKYIARFTEGIKPEEDPEDPNGEDDEIDTSVSIEDLDI